MGKLGRVAAALALCVGCSGGVGSGGHPSGETTDGGVVNDGGVTTDGGSDAGTGTDGGVDAGSDGGTDAGSDGGTKVTFGGPGPWPLDNVTYGPNEGIQETPVVATSTDESQNLWVATHSALYLMRPGQKTFQRFDGTGGKGDGNNDVALHLQNNPVVYCADQNFVSGDRTCRPGAASDPGISTIVGGGANEVFVGYYGFHDYNNLANDGEWFDIYRHTGKLDRVRIVTDSSGNPVVDTNGKVAIQVVRMDLVSGNSPEFWHNRTVYRMVFDHFIHPHELFVGAEHGIDKLSPDLWFPPNKNWPFLDNLYWLSDHLHPATCLHELCADNEQLNVQMMGEWRGLALSAQGDLWVGGKWSAGKIFYVAPNSQIGADGNPDPNGHTGWFQRSENKALGWISAYTDPATGLSYAFGFQFCGTSGQRNEWSGSAWVPSTCSPFSGTPPVFWPPAPGDPVSISAVTETPDGRSWWASAPNGPFPAYGIAVRDGFTFKYYDPVRDVGLGETAVSDMLALPDGRLVVAGPNSGLVFWDPVKGTRTTMRGGSGLPDDHVMRLELDRMVDPPALHVSTWNGATVLRKFP